MMEASLDVHVELDIGNLLVSNIIELKPSAQSQGEQWLKSLAQKGTQMLINKMWELPSEYQENIVVAKLPEPTTKIPREKHIPKPKPPTRWEQFAQSKGIQKKKKDKLVFDEATKEWKPRFGYRSIKSDKSKWLVEIPDNADPNVDYFAKEKDEKVQRVAKNEFQRLRNVAEASKIKVRNMEAVDKASKEEIARTVATAKTATASVGKFVNKLPKEKPAKNMGKKRKFESNYVPDLKAEKERNLKILEGITKKRPKLDIQQAVQIELQKSGKTGSDESGGAKKSKLGKTHAKKNKTGKTQGKKNKHGKTQGKRNKKTPRKFSSSQKKGRNKSSFKKT